LAIATAAVAAGEEFIPHALTRRQVTVFQALVEARNRFGGSRSAVVDGDERILTYDDLVRAALALGNALRKGTMVGEAVGVMLPTSAGSVISFYALSAFGRVPTMLNFTNGAASVLSSMRTAKVRRVVTARKFIELAKLDDMAAELAANAEMV
jgi:acyl-[acyl-carrier-protein]-phospholipid O-acyltransferase / long-chain-fatty-acid--[acyl-carrier-protein] ligase